MRSLITHHTARLMSYAVVLVLHPILHLALALGMGLALGTGPVGTDTGAPEHARPDVLAGDRWEDHDLFNPSATLDPGQVDDLRYGPAAAEGRCIATKRVMTPEGRCVDGVFLWPDEVDAATWNALRDAGYTWVIDLATEAIYVPAELVTLDGDDVQSVRLP